MWHNQLPSWLTQGVANGTISDSQLRDLLHQHITTEVGRYRGSIWQWDVVNEMFTDSNPSQLNPNDFWISHLGPGVIADAFRWAKAADPRALLCYNDYNIAGEDGSNAKFEAVFSMVQNLLAQGVPIGCVGDQGHLDLQYGFNPNLMTKDLQEHASLGVKVAITEADVRTFVETTDSNQSPVVSPTDSTPNHTANPAAADWYVGMLQSCLTVRACISRVAYRPLPAERQAAPSAGRETAVTRIRSEISRAGLIVTVDALPLHDGSRSDRNRAAEIVSWSTILRSPEPGQLNDRVATPSRSVHRENHTRPFSQTVMRTP